METNEKKKISVTTVLLAVIFIALVAIIGYLTFTRVMDHANRQNSTKEPTSVVEEEPKILTGEETDAPSDIKSEILSKTNALLKIENDKTTVNIEDVGHTKELFENLTLDSDNKLRLALYISKKDNLHSTKQEVSRKEVIDLINDYINFYTIDQYFSGDYIGEYNQIDGDEVARNYKELFNEEINHKDVNDWCPFIYYYDAKSNQYYANNQCGGIASDMILYYFDKATVRDNEAYAYIYIGYMDNGTHENNKTNIFSDIDKKNILETISSENSQNYTITASNKEKFTKYKITFKLDKSNNYYFDKIEK